MAYKVFIFILLMVTWVILSGQFDAFHLVLGLISCALVTWMSADLLFRERDAPVLQRVQEGWSLAWYFLWMLWQILLANIAILKLALSPSALQQVDPSIVHFKTKLKSNFAKFLLANSITLTPGTVTIKISGDDFYVHAINDEAAAGLNGEMERRIASIYRAESAAAGGKGDC